MSSLVMARITVEKFWPDGVTVNAVYEEHGRELGLNPHTLKKALEGSLSSIKPDKLVALKELCSIWAGRKVSLDEVVLDD